MRRGALVSLALLGALACRAKKPAAADPAAAMRELALIKVEGDLPVDAMLRRLRAAAQHNPAKAENWIELGNAWVRKARDSATPAYYRIADACAEVALGLSPHNRLALDLRGLALMNDHRFEEARRLEQSIVDVEPSDAMAWGTLSDALLELGRTGEAAQAMQRMMDLKPNLPSYSRAAHILWLRGDVAGAKEAVRLAIDAGADSRDLEPRAWVIVQAAQIFWNEGDLDGAEAGYDRALQDVADFAPALAGKGQVALARGDARAAVRLLLAAYRRSPLVSTLWLLGDARLAAGDTQSAEEVYQRIGRQGGNDPRTLALFLATKDRERERALQLAEAERTVRDDQYTEDAWAWALYRADRLAEARAASDRATQLGTRDAKLLYHAGAIRLAAGEAQGRKLVLRALALNPHFDLTGASEARRLLGEHELARRR